VRRAERVRTRLFFIPPTKLWGGVAAMVKPIGSLVMLCVSALCSGRWALGPRSHHLLLDIRVVSRGSSRVNNISTERRTVAHPPRPCVTGPRSVSTVGSWTSPIFARARKT
jgi:hypothetical protein